MFRRPGVVDSDPVGERDLVERLRDQELLIVLRPGLGKLKFVEDAETHTTLSRIGSWQGGLTD